jgi:hypothetical protein
MEQISTHPKVRHEGIGTMLYDARKKIVKTLNSRRIVSGARLFYYCEPSSKSSPLEFAEKVINGEIHDPVLSFDVENGFKFIEILPNYLEDVRSLNNASFREWSNQNIIKIDSESISLSSPYHAIDYAARQFLQGLGYQLFPVA